MLTREELMKTRAGRAAGTEIRLIRKAFADFEGETDPTRKRGYAAILQGHIDLYLEESSPRPGMIAKGRHDDSKFRMKPEAFANDDIELVDAYPFDDGGESAGLGFYCAQTGHFSPLFKGPPYHRIVGALLSYGYFVYGMEKRYATGTATTHHLTDSHVLPKLGRAMRAPKAKKDEERHLVLCDPAGQRAPEGLGSLTALETGDLSKAHHAADKLAALLDIRFVVATQRMCYDTH